MPPLAGTLAQGEYLGVIWFWSLAGSSEVKEGGCIVDPRGEL